MSGTRCEKSTARRQVTLEHLSFLGPKQLQTPQNSKWECKIPMGYWRLRIAVSRSPVMVIFDQLLWIQMHPLDRTCMHDQIPTPNSKSYL